MSASKLPARKSVPAKEVKVAKVTTKPNTKAAVKVATRPTKVEVNKTSKKINSAANAVTIPSGSLMKSNPENEMAAKIILKFCRQVYACKEFQKRKAEKEEYNNLMEKLEKEAFLKLVKMQQEQAERERIKEEEEKKRKAEHLKRCKRMLEAAFDGDSDGMVALLNEVDELVNKEKFDDEVVKKAVRMKRRMLLVECEDPNGNSPLSESASGGHVECIQMLNDHGADPNSRGHFNRTPLYRAAFAGHLDACQALLQCGADPRLRAEDGNTAAEVTSVEAIKQLLQEWDISLTERMLNKIEADKHRRNELEKQKREAEESKLESQLKQVEKEHAMRQKMFQKASDELNKRIKEHDRASVEGLVKPEITLQSIHDAEFEFETAKLELEKACDKLTQARYKLREKIAENKDEKEDTDTDNSVKILIRDLHDVLMMDVGNKIHNSGKWPLIIDSSGQAATFLRYRDTNYINAMSPRDMLAEKVRLSLIGALRYGKILVLDMMDVDMFDTCTWRFDEVMPGLMMLLMDKSIMEEKNYSKLLKKSDGPEYELKQFNENRVSNFRFFLISKTGSVSPSLLERTYPIKVFMPL